MIDLLQQIFAGLANGTVYAGLALGLCVVFQGTGVLNFGQGEMAAFSTLVTWQFLSMGWGFWAAMAAAVTLSFLAGMLVERALIRPVEGSEELSLLVVTLGLFLGFNALMGMIWGFHPKNVDSPFGNGVLDLGGAVMTAQQLGMIVVIGGVAMAVGAFFKLTDAGLRMRAAAESPDSSRLLGIHVGRQLMIGWGLAAAVGAAAGAMSSPVVGAGPDMMRATILMAFAAAALGGFTSRLGAVVGGLVVGVTTSLAAAYVPGLGGDLSLIVPFALITVVLLIRPQGLFGRVDTVRA